MENPQTANSTLAPAQDATQPQEEKQSSKDIIATLFKEKDSYEQSTKDQRAEVNEIYNAYMGKMENVKNLPYANKETIPKMRTEIAYIKPQIFSGEPEIEVDGVGDEDKALAKIFEKMVNYRFQTIPQFYEKIESWVHQSVTFGTSIIRVIWKFEVEEQTDQTPGLDGKPQVYQTPVKDEPDLEVPNILDTFKNPIITEIENQSCMIFRSVLPVDEVKENPMYDYVEDLGDGKPNREKVMSRGNYKVDQYNSSSQVQTDIANAQKATDGLVEIFDRVTDEQIQTVADGAERLVLRDVENPYGFINAVKLTFEPNAIPNRFDGLGVGQNTLGLGKMYYSMFNQTLTGVKLTNNPMFIFEKGNGIDTRQLVAKPGGGIGVDKSGVPLANKIVPIQFPDVKSGAIDILNKMDDEHKRASGANDLLQGSASNSTLGQDQLAQSNTSARFELIQRRFKHALADVADMIIKMELQNLQSPDAEILRIFPQELRGQIYQLLISEAKDVKYNVSVRGTTNVARNKNLEAKRKVELFQIATSIQTAAGPLLTNDEMRAFLRDIAEEQGMQNIDELIAAQGPQPVPQMQQGQPQIDPATGQPMPPQGMPPMNPMQGAVSQQGMNAGMNNAQ